MLPQDPNQWFTPFNNYIDNNNNNNNNQQQQQPVSPDRVWEAENGEIQEPLDNDVIVATGPNDVDTSDYREIVAAQTITYDLSKQVNPRTLNVVDSIHIEDFTDFPGNEQQRQIALNDHIRSNVRGLPQIYFGDRGTGMGDIMPSSRVLIETRQSIENYLSFVESVLVSDRYARLKNNNVKARLSLMSSGLRNDILDQINDVLNVPVYDFSTANNFTAFKYHVASEIWGSFYQLKVPGMKNDDLEKIMLLFMLREYMSQQSTVVEFTRMSFFIPFSNTVQTGIASSRRSFETENLSIANIENYRTNLLLRLFMNYVIDDPQTRVQKVFDTLGKGIDIDFNMNIADIIKFLIEIPAPDENFILFYKQVQADMTQDNQIIELFNLYYKFMNSEDISLFHVSRFLETFLNQRNEDIMDAIFPGATYIDGDFIKEITRSRYRRAVDMAKIKMIVEGSFVFDWKNPDGDVIPQYFEGYFKKRGLEYLKIILDYMMYRDNYNLPDSPQTSLSPLEGSPQQGSPTQIMQDNQLPASNEENEVRRDMTLSLINTVNMENLRNISIDNWLFGLSANQVDLLIAYQDGDRTINPDSIIDSGEEPDVELLRASLSEPIIIKNVKGAQLKRYILDGFFTLIPSTMELITRYCDQLKKMFKRIFELIYGTEFITRTGLYADNDVNNRLDIDTYDRIPYHSISLTLRRGDETTLQSSMYDTVFDFTDPRYKPGEIRTKFQKKPLYELLEKLQENMGKYESDYNYIVEIKIDILELYNKALAFGKLRSAYDLGSRSIPKLREKYILVDTTTETNCLFACCYTAIEFEQDYKILQNETRRQRGAVVLKNAIYSYLDVSNNLDLLDTIDENGEYNFNNSIYQAISDYYGRRIEVYNNVFSKFREITPKNNDKKREPIRIMIHLMHASLMITKDYFNHIYEKQALPIKRESDDTIKRYLRRDFGIDVCNNVIRRLKDDKDQLSRELKRLYKDKLGNMYTREDDETISRMVHEIILKHNNYLSIKNYFKSVLKIDMIKDTIGHCRIINEGLNTPDDPWTEVRNTSKGDIYLQGYQKQVSPDEFDFLCNNRVIEFRPLDTVGKFTLLETKKQDPVWRNKIGSIDLETSLDDKQYQQCYAGGVAFFDFGKETQYPSVDFDQDIVCERFYNDESETALEKTFRYLFELREQLDEYVFYAHNGGKFDYPIIISQYLSKNDELWRLDSSSFVEMNGAVMSMTITSTVASKGRDDEGREFDYYPKITFRDSLRLITGKLETICIENKVKHQKLIYDKTDPRYVDHTMITLSNFKDLLWKIDPYLEHDCKGLLEVMMLFSYNIYKDMKINIVNCYTSATLAKKNFFQNYYDDVQYPIYNLPPTFDKILRSCYAGGRVESFVLGHIKQTTKIRDTSSPYYREKRIFYHDVTSEYPDQGRRDLPYGIPHIHQRDDCTNCFTTELVHYIDENGDEGHVENDVLTEECFGFVEVEVYCDMRRAANTRLKPVHHILLDKNHDLCKERKYLANTLLFPWFKTTVKMWICSEEIKYCQQLNLPYIYRVLNVMSFKRAPYLKQLFEDCVKKKEEAGNAGNKCMRLTWKTTANSTYGFFALKINARDSVIILDQKEAMYWQRYLRDSRLRNVAQYPKYTMCRIDKDISIKDVNVSIAAFITSYSRMKLHNIITKIESTGHKVYYCDTDSVISSCPLNLYPVIDNELRWDGTGEALGSLKNEAAEKIQGIVDKLIPLPSNPTQLDKDQVKQSRKAWHTKELDREDNMEPGFNDAYFMGSKMYYLEMDKTTPEGVEVFYTACAFKGFKKDDHVSHEKNVRAGKEDKSLPFLKDIFGDLNDNKIFEKEQTQFRGGKTSLMNEHTRGGVKVSTLVKKYKKYYIKGVQIYNETEDIIDVIPHVL